MKNKNTIVIVLAVVCVLLMAGVGYTVLAGRDKDKAEGSSQSEGDTQEQFITYEGEKYKENADIKTMLFMGVDQTAEAELSSRTGYAGQTDSLNLIVMDTKTKEAQIVQISRDSMVDIDIYGESGDKLATERGQIALQYAYGDGKTRSCQLTEDRVSELLGGISIDSYISLTMDGISAATDAIGGVTLTVPEDYTDIDPTFQAGAEVTLTGALAEKYVRSRDTNTLDSNNQRMQRQSQFMNALISQMNSSDMGTGQYASLYQTMEPYMVSNMTADEMKALSEYSFAGDMIVVPGEVIEKDGHAQYIVNNETLRAIIVKTFYKKM